MSSLIYTPRYFGPNAFPIPEINSGKIDDEYKLEMRFDFHKATGDNTRNLYTKMYLPFGRKAAIEASWIIREFYHTSEAIKAERHAYNMQPANGNACVGDVVINVYYQLIESEKWLDILFSFGLKTASGNMLVDARYTDAANYWFDMNFGKNLFQTKEKDIYLRLVAKMGFYCYMTNSMVHRQNDALMGGGGLKIRLKNLYADADFRGFSGYWNNGDSPFLFRTELKYRLKNHSFFINYSEGLYDWIFTTYSAGYGIHF
ncbi:hypothetical protein FACS1894160_4950 [Bacteroidia bacterium]|nr:hypothetical protein FACS1894160_4950 [Bacteroidia bacterium]